MTEKYIDLADEIGDFFCVEPPTILAAYIRNTLRWLDEHPDQVPGRTITASEFDEAVESCITEDATVPPHTFAARLGVVCVPDPEPTNAEKLRKVLDTLEVDEQNLDEVAELLDKAGVKAPGGDG